MKVKSFEPCFSPPPHNWETIKGIRQCTLTPHAPPSDATQPAADDCQGCSSHTRNCGSPDYCCPLCPSAAASPTAANENSPNEGADASQAVRSLPSWLVAEAAKAIEMHAQAKGCRCDLAEDGVCPFFVGWWTSKCRYHITDPSFLQSMQTSEQQFYALVKEK